MTFKYLKIFGAKKIDFQLTQAFFFLKTNLTFVYDLCLKMVYFSLDSIELVLFYFRLFFIPFMFLFSREVEHIILLLGLCFNLSLAFNQIALFGVCLLFVNLFVVLFSILPIEFLSSLSDYCVNIFLLFDLGFIVCESFYAVLDLSVVLCLVD